jgi:hypothetical protein
MSNITPKKDEKSKVMPILDELSPDASSKVMPISSSEKTSPKIHNKTRSNKPLPKPLTQKLDDYDYLNMEEGNASKGGSLRRKKRSSRKKRKTRKTRKSRKTYKKRKI